MFDMFLMNLRIFSHVTEARREQEEVHIWFFLMLKELQRMKKMFLMIVNALMSN
jgi:hypothetical protein